MNNVIVLQVRDGKTNHTGMSTLVFFESEASMKKAVEQIIPLLAVHGAFIVENNEIHDFRINGVLVQTNKNKERLKRYEETGS